MTQYTLSLAFDSATLNTFAATGTNIVVAKPSGDSSAPNVAWVVFSPLENNTIQWYDQYGIYASNAEVQNGASLVQTSQVPFPATTGLIYDFTDAGAFSPGQSGGQPNEYTVKNEYSKKPYITIGLYQNASVNGSSVLGSAVSAAGVIYNFTALIIPYTTVYVWAQSQVQSNTVVTKVSSPMTQVPLTANKPSASLQYDPPTGTFSPKSEETKTLFGEFEIMLPTGIY
ncbi:hypothetical protein [Microcystis aeruginosa]|uniref:Uncharacterized protein n=1 Tax=Microcystis aeruginosa PCC 9443 TaxID=1160281 RepID=I4G5V7_MICAE|nr:hypothetical protein [Microcystis aeruginosa]CCI03318.1 conserved exported hypothetical protein [Microcystis aeruginosa PCC 9443]